MYSHLTILGAINILRGIGGLILAACFIYFSEPANLPFLRARRLEPGDLMAFLFTGYVVGVFAAVRLLHGCSVLWLIHKSGSQARRGAPIPDPGKASTWLRKLFNGVRSLGFWLSFVDLIDITLFPITTACGLYGILVCRNIGIVDILEAKKPPVWPQTA